jgi:hypothetical protein
MSTKRQHYVPRVYLKNWETKVSSKNEPNKFFNGIYHFQKNNLSTGDGRNIGSILWKPHIYTIEYEDYFMLKLLPEVEKDYIEQAMEKLKERKVIAFLNGRKLKTRTDLRNNFLSLDNWEFEYNYYPFNKAKTLAIISDIKSIHSYVIESALDNVVETKWQSCLNDFISQMETAIPLNEKNGMRQIAENSVIEIVKMIIFLMCRNPDFDCLGVFPAIKHVFLEDLFETSNNAEEKSLEEFTSQQMRAIWLNEIYNGLFNADKGFFYTSKQQMKKSCQIILFKCWEERGSFIASDNPAFYNKSFVASDNFNSIICPLTPEYLVMILRGKDKSLNNVDFRCADNTLIKKLNTIILNNAKEIIISNYKTLGNII